MTCVTAVAMLTGRMLGVDAYRKTVSSSGHLIKKRQRRIQLQYGLGQPKDWWRTYRKVLHHLPQGNKSALSSIPATLSTQTALAVSLLHWSDYAKQNIYVLLST